MPRHPVRGGIVAIRRSRDRAPGSAASRVFVVVTIAVAVLGALLAVLLVLDAQRAARAEAEGLTGSVARTIAAVPDIATALTGSDPSATLQPEAEQIMRTAGVDFVTIMTPDGIRVAHLDPSQIGQHYLGTIPEQPVALTEEFTGTL
ncbi:MAG: hypothetical protein KKH75_06095, partial [Actinobacteria bacterium]|nr:hypothetical protein [Actinomycetota bacterium]